MGEIMTDYYEFGDEIFDDVVVVGKFGGETSGFGVVYIVMDKTSNNMLAMKTLKKEQMSISDFEDFKNEVLPWMEVSKHPNIVSAFAVDLDDNQRPYLLMEPIFPDENGKHSLNDFMDDEICEEQILKWCIQFCYAMDYVNEKAYIHGDIKPDNILIGNGIIKLTDFGLVMPIEENISIKDYRGSLYYLAPESFDGIKNISSDIYSFGMVMYQMVNFGVLPFDGDTIEEWVNFHKYGNVPTLNSDLFPVIKKCLEKNSINRFSSFEELNIELKKLLYEKYHKKIKKPELEDIDNIRNMNRGHSAAMFNDVENCIKFYEIAISNSDNQFVLFNYALDLVSLKKYDNALIILKNLLLNSDNLPVNRIYFNIALCYHEKICLYKSIKYYKKAIKINKNYFEAHVNLANIYKDYGLFEDALFHYKYVLDKNPTFKEALVNIIDLYDKMKDSLNRDRYISKLQNETDNSLTTYYGGLFLKDENILSFLTSMDNSSRNYVFQIPALIQLFEFHLKNGSISEANDKFDEIFDLIKNDIGKCISLCYSYVTFGFYEEAIDKMDYIYLNADENEKDNILFEKSKLLKNFDLLESINICKSLIKKDIDDVFKSKIYVNLGRFYSDIDPDASFDYFLKAYNINPKNTRALLNLSSHHAKKRLFYIAEDYINQGLEIEPNDYDLVYNKARLCLDQFKYDEAIKYFNICLKINPTSEVYGFIALCFCYIENFTVAIFYLKLAINICLDVDFKLLIINGLFSLETELSLIDGGYYNI